MRWCTNRVPRQERFDDEHRRATLTAHEARWRGAGIGVLRVHAGRSCVLEQRACERQVGGARAVGQQAVVANGIHNKGDVVGGFGAKDHGGAFIRSAQGTFSRIGATGRLYLGQGAVRRSIAEFVLHYHHERNHEGPRNQLIQPERRSSGVGASVCRRERLGGMLSFYYSAA